MQATKTRDFIVGCFVLAGFLALAYLSFQVGGLSYTGNGGLKLFAVFDEIGSLSVRAPVTISGVTVGRVEAIELDEPLRAKVTIDVETGLELPIDSTAGIRTWGWPPSSPSTCPRPGSPSDSAWRGGGRQSHG